MLGRGAGSGRIWMEEGEIKERPTESRVREAVAFDSVESIVVAAAKTSPCCATGRKITGQEGDLMVEDLIELVHAAM